MALSFSFNCFLFLAFYTSCLVNGLECAGIITKEDDPNIGMAPLRTIQNQSTSYEYGATEASMHNEVLAKDKGCKDDNLLQGRFVMKGLNGSHLFSNDREDIIRYYAALRHPRGEYYGAMATLNVYGLPEVNAYQASGGFIWIVNDKSLDRFNAIQIGWCVDPRIYGDHDTHLYFIWTSDYDYKTGCNDLRCKGFVPEPSSVYLPGRVITKEDDPNIRKAPLRTIQNQPTLYEYGATEASIHNGVLAQNEGCKDDSLVRGRLVMKGLNGSHSFSNGSEDLIFYYAALRQPKGEYYGAMATLNVYGLPEVNEYQGSGGFIWIVNDKSLDRFNAIQIGWSVSPKIYGDHDTHLSISWTSDYDYKTGCSDLLCKGFVPEPSSVYLPGNKLSPLSTYNGTQYEITLKILQDPNTGDWRVYAGPNGNISVGYFPKSLFTSLTNGASEVQFGGLAGFFKNSAKSPPMGSGHFPDEGFGKAAYMRNLKLISRNGELYDPNSVLIIQDKKECYRIRWKNGIYFGGPGGC